MIHNRGIATLSLGIAVLFSISAHGAESPTAIQSGGVTDITLDAHALEQNASLVSLRYDPEGQSIALNNMDLIEDDAPATGQPEGHEFRSSSWIEDLSDGTVIRKTLMLDDPRAYSGRLVFHAIETPGNTATLHIELNGIPIDRPASQYAQPLALQYNLGWDRWFYVDIPVGALHKGTNDVIMKADSDSTAWRIMIALEEEFARGSLTRRHHPNRSFKSDDGGTTWRDRGLGSDNSVDGEYSIRFSLDRYVPRGEYISPVIDLVDGDAVLKHRATIESLKITADIAEPDNTDATVYIRTSSDPRLDSSSWTQFRSLAEGENGVTPDQRYIQLKAVLETADPLSTPEIRAIRIQARWNRETSGPDNGIRASVISNGIIRPSSYPFAYEDLSHPGLTTYRENHRLDSIVAGAVSEFYTMMRLLNWAYRIPVSSEPYSWDWNKVTVINRDEDGMPRLQSEYTGRRRDAMCLYSNQALIGALLSMGYQARHINIHSEGISGHEVTEVWSDDFNKWIYMDATRDYYYYDIDTGTPLNLLEIHNLLAAGMPEAEDWRRPFAPVSGPETAAHIKVGMRQGINQYSIEDHGRHILETMGHFRIIPRNDFLSNPLPVPVHTGNTMWGWDGFLNWYDDIFPRRYEYQRYTNRPMDFYDPLNQSCIRLVETGEQGVLTVQMETFTPGGFDTYLVRKNDSEWIEQSGDEWLWTLMPGLNSLEVRSRNVLGVTGPVSNVRVTFNP